MSFFFFLKIMVVFIYLIIILELSIVLCPELLDEVKVIVIKELIKLSWILIVEYSESLKFIFYPIPRDQNFGKLVLLNI